MPLNTAIPILAFLELKSSVAFYEQLGFEVNAKWEEYLMCKRDHIEIHLWKTNDPEVPKNTGCYVRVNEIYTFYEECKQLQIVHPNGPLKDQPWGMRQFSILDNSGNIINFGEYLN
jgi:hypothetical protein